MVFETHRLRILVLRTVSKPMQPTHKLTNGPDSIQSSRYSTMLYVN